MKILVSFSGGKDSQACLIQAFKQYGGGNLTAVFCDTGWEHPDTYKHVNDVCLQMGVRLITLKSKYDFVSLAAHKKRFPSTNARFCTSELKMKPMIDYVLSLKESCIIIQGIRAGESTARAAMEEECMYFKSYFQPNKKGRTENYRSKDVKEWCSQYDASVLRPIFKWSAQQVIDCILDAGQVPNPLYYRGFSRVGCFPCIMCRHKEIELIAKNDPDENYFSISEGLFNDKHPYRTYDYAGRIDCGTNEELFLAIAALRDDTDKYQWFIPPAGAWVYNKGYESILEVSLKWRKATVNELIEHFKEKEEI